MEHTFLKYSNHNVLPWADYIYYKRTLSYKSLYFNFYGSDRQVWWHISSLRFKWDNNLSYSSSDKWDLIEQKKNIAWFFSYKYEFQTDFFLIYGSTVFLCSAINISIVFSIANINGILSRLWLSSVNKAVHK